LPAFPLAGRFSLSPLQCSPSSVHSVELTGSPKFLCASFHAYHALIRPRQILQDLTFSGPFVLASEPPDAITICSLFFYEAVSSFRECGLPCGLRDPCVRLRCYVRLIALPPHICNTRYEWLVRPYSAGTCTPQETPSFAWRSGWKRVAPGGSAVFQALEPGVWSRKVSEPAERATDSKRDHSSATLCSIFKDLQPASSFRSYVGQTEVAAR
jgi:hypothetical protein